MFSGFAQDEITLMRSGCNYTAGAKFEHNGYNGLNFNPTGVLVTPGEHQNLLGLYVARAHAFREEDNHRAHQVNSPGSQSPFTATGIGIGM